MKQLITILEALVCLCSCEKQEQSHWLHNLWSGEYDITMTNNDTGEQEPHVALKRALQTAEIINETKNVPIIIDERISERCFGDYEGVNDLAFPFDEFWGFSIERDFKGAEGLKEFFDRVYGFLDDIREIHKDKKILLVTHGGVSIPTKCYFNGIPDRKTFFDLCIGNCEIVKFEYK